MASKRKADLAPTEQEVTPTGKKPKQSTSSTGRRQRKLSTAGSVSPFVIEISPQKEMPSNNGGDASQRSPKPPSAEEFKAMLKDGLANVAKKEQLDRMMVQISSNTDALQSLQKRVDTTNEATERRFLAIEERIQQQPTRMDSLDRSRRAAFEKSRRSLRIWPIKGDDTDELDASFKDFAVDALMVPDTVVRQTALAEIIRVRSSPRNAVYMEALVTFKDQMQRDFYFSKAKHLAPYRDESGAPTAGIRMDIPPYLMATFNSLNNHGYEIKRANGPDTKRYMKYDEVNLSLYLEVRLLSSTKWTRIRPEQARIYGEEKDRQEYQTIRKTLLRTTSPSPNPNLIPLGNKPGHHLPSQQPTPSTSTGVERSQRPTWTPPPRASPPKRYSLRNSQNE